MARPQVQSSCTHLSINVKDFNHSADDSASNMESDEFQDKHNTAMPHWNGLKSASDPIEALDDLDDFDEELFDSKDYASAEIGLVDEDTIEPPLLTSEKALHFTPTGSHVPSEKAESLLKELEEIQDWLEHDEATPSSERIEQNSNSAAKDAAPEAVPTLDLSHLQGGAQAITLASTPNALGNTEKNDPLLKQAHPSHAGSSDVGSSETIGTEADQDRPDEITTALDGDSRSGDLFNEEVAPEVDPVEESPNQDLDHLSDASDTEPEIHASSLSVDNDFDQSAPTEQEQDDIAEPTLDVAKSVGSSSVQSSRAIGKSAAKPMNAEVERPVRVDNPFLPAAIRQRLHQQNKDTMSELNSLGDSLKRGSDQQAMLVKEHRKVSNSKNDLEIEKLIRRHVTDFEIELRKILKRSRT